MNLMVPIGIDPKKEVQEVQEVHKRQEAAEI